ncbi:hypothetical protein PHMEG_00022589 [Phytophthora megakarya]|uniref:Uncharacterized protein n=1 Tax=Phytophthora megakarya TaxID=4795 RepID=A0A225VKD3_9STRA|nr:hypothetical protein PHMEG_00022589 [Phytophthora megakarya]
MAKRTTTQRSEKERIALLKQWKSHPQWTAGDAARELQVNVRMLNDWKKRYWDGLDTATGSDRVRGEGGGRPRTKKPYEDNILQFYNRCRRDGIRCAICGGQAQ